VTVGNGCRDDTEERALVFHSLLPLLSTFSLVYEKAGTQVRALVFARGKDHQKTPASGVETGGFT
jgi:hypothetical protein